MNYKIYVLSSKNSQLPYEVENLINDKSKNLNWKFIGEVDDLEIAREMVYHDKPIIIKNKKIYKLTQEPWDEGNFDFVKIEYENKIEYYDFYNGEHGNGFIFFRRK